MCIHDWQAKARVWENPPSRTLTHIIEELIMCFDEMKSDVREERDRTATLNITLTSPLRPEAEDEEEEEDPCIQKKQPEAFSCPLCPPVSAQDALSQSFHNKIQLIGPVSSRTYN